MEVFLKDIKNNDLPREKLQQSGAHILENFELIAILLGTGGRGESALETANKLVSDYSDLSLLANCDLNELSTRKNVGLAKACSIKAAIELGRRAAISSPKDIIKITGPLDVYALLKTKIGNQHTEHLYLISLNSRNKIISTELLTIGTVNETLISPREIIKHALSRNAVSIILCHNHPSGETDPSSDDVKITKKLVNICSKVGVKLLDHLIISDKNYTSLKALNLLQPSKGGDN